MSNPRPKPWRDAVQLFPHAFAPDPADMRRVLAHLDRCPPHPYACDARRSPCATPRGRCGV